MKIGIEFLRQTGGNGIRSTTMDITRQFCTDFLDKTDVAVIEPLLLEPDDLKNLDRMMDLIALGRKIIRRLAAVGVRVRQALDAKQIVDAMHTAFMEIVMKDIDVVTYESLRTQHSGLPGHSASFLSNIILARTCAMKLLEVQQHEDIRKLPPVIEVLSAPIQWEPGEQPHVQN